MSTIPQRKREAAVKVVAIMGKDSLAMMEAHSKNFWSNEQLSLKIIQLSDGEPVLEPNSILAH